MGLVFIDLGSKSVEILSAISDDGIPIRFADDVAVAGNGIVYFSDASRVSPSVSETGDYNLIQTSLLDALLGSGTGRLLAYNPTDKSTTTLIDNLLFANGVSMSDDDSFVLVCETFGYRVTRFWLDGPRKDTVDYFATRLPGFPDSIHPAADGGFWVAINSEVDICEFCICQPIKMLKFCTGQSSLRCACWFFSTEDPCFIYQALAPSTRGHWGHCKAA